MTPEQIKLNDIRPDDRIDMLHAKGNPKRAGSESANYWHLYEHGMTALEFCVLMAIHHPMKHPLGCIKWDVNHGLIALSRGGQPL